MHHIVPQNACKSAKLRCTELALLAVAASCRLAGGLADISACHGSNFSSSCGARKDRTRSLGITAGRDLCRLKNEERCGGE
jgi:hypothetical protein